MTAIDTLKALTPHYTDPLVTLWLGDCLEVMPTLEAESVDAVVTDPPYGLAFMGKHWDHGVPVRAFWEEMLRLTKPGGYLLAFGGTRTVHRIATNIEDAGWIIRDQLTWIYASGFPKGKANLKPAHEPIVLARKPGPLRPLAIDECRIGMTAEDAASINAKHAGMDVENYKRPGGTSLHLSEKPDSLPLIAAEAHPAGRWPSNVLLSDPELFDQPNPYVVGSGATSDPKPERTGLRGGTAWHGQDGFGSPDQDGRWPADPGGGYSRFFIIPKADRAERERGLAWAPKQHGGSMSGPETRPDRPTNHPLRANVHPTVKPIDLIRHLVRLVTPPGGTVLDPFLGSGTTALAASEEGVKCIGIEREAEYLEIAVGRLMATPMGLGLDTPIVGKKPPKTHPDLAKHQPKRRAASENYTGGWAGTDEEPAA